MRKLSRRALLRAGLGIGVCGMAGCLGRRGRGSDHGCSDGERWDIAFRRVGHGTYEGFRLAADPETVALGDDITFRLRNVSGEPRSVGTDGNYTIQDRHTGGWRNVFSTEAGIGWDGSAKSVDPDELAFAWTFTVAETGFEDARYELCDPLTPGEYRFVYWGLPDRPPTATEGGPDGGLHAVARRFSITA